MRIPFIMVSFVKVLVVDHRVDWVSEAGAHEQTGL